MEAEVLVEVDDARVLESVDHADDGEHSDERSRRRFAEARREGGCREDRDDRDQGRTADLHHPGGVEIRVDVPVAVLDQRLVEPEFGELPERREGKQGDAEQSERLGREQVGEDGDLE